MWRIIASSPLPVTLRRGLWPFSFLFHWKSSRDNLNFKTNFWTTTNLACLHSSAFLFTKFRELKWLVICHPAKHCHDNTQYYQCMIIMKSEVWINSLIRIHSLFSPLKHKFLKHWLLFSFGFIASKFNNSNFSKKVKVFKKFKFCCGRQL